MKIGKGASSVLTMPLHSVVLLTVGFLFGFLSALSFNQVRRKEDYKVFLFTFVFVHVDRKRMV